MDLVRLNATAVIQDRYKSQQKTKSVPRFPMEEMSMSQLVQVIRSGARKGHNRRFLEQSYELEAEVNQEKLYPVIGAGTMAAALLITQSDKLQGKFNAVKPAPTIDRSTASASALSISVDAPKSESLPFAASLPTVSSSVIEMAQLEARVTAALPPERELVTLDQKPPALEAPPTLPANGITAKPAKSVKVNSVQPTVSKLIRTEPSGIDSVADQVLTSLQRVGSASKSYFDVLSGISTTDYLIQLFQPTVSVVQDKIVTVGQASLSFLDAHPELKLSTSDYLERLFEPQVKELSSSIASVGMEPLKFLDEHPELKLSTSEYLARLLQPKVNEIVGSFGVVAGKSNEYLDANPDLKLPTSKYLTKLVEVDLKPKLVAYLKDQSKTILDENPDFKLSTSEYFKKIVQPQIDSSLIAIKDISTKFISDAVEATSTTANRALTTAISQAEQQIAIQTARVTDPLPSLSLPSSEIDQITDQILTSLGTTASSTLSTVADASSKFIEASGPALFRAGATFTSELGEAGVKLGVNLVSGLEYTGQAIGRLTLNSLKSIFTPDTYLSAIPTPRISPPALPPAPSIEKVASKLSDTINAVQNWYGRNIFGLKY